MKDVGCDNKGDRPERSQPVEIMLSHVNRIVNDETTVIEANDSHSSCKLGSPFACDLPKTGVQLAGSMVAKLRFRSLGVGLAFRHGPIVHEANAHCNAEIPIEGGCLYGHRFKMGQLNRYNSRALALSAT